MNTYFSPNNNIVKLCMLGMQMEASEKIEEAKNLFMKAWTEASDDFEKFIAAYYVARHQNSILERLNWLKTALNHALKVEDHGVKSALTILYSNISECYAVLNEPKEAKHNEKLSNEYKNLSIDKGPFYHGTKADLQVGDLLTAGEASNYEPELKMNHIYFTALIDGAGLAAALAKGDGKERIYIVEPTGLFENDPNVTNKKFPGNLTRSYRSQEPLKIIGEETHWEKQKQESIQEWRKKLANHKGEIIN